MTQEDLTKKSGEDHVEICEYFDRHRGFAFTATTEEWKKFSNGKPFKPLSINLHFK